MPNKTSTELYSEYTSALERERKERNRKAEKVRKKLKTGSFTVTHKHSRCLETFRSGLSHVVTIEEARPDLPKEDWDLLHDHERKARSGSFYYEHGKLSGHSGYILFPGLWIHKGFPEGQDDNTHEIIEDFLSTLPWDSDFSRDLDISEVSWKEVEDAS